MGARDSAVLDRASDLGIAFQLTNIARDVIDDARSGRVYLPAELLREQGLDAVDPGDAAQWPLLHSAALRLLDIAEPYYTSALAGMSVLPGALTKVITPSIRRMDKRLARRTRD